MLALLKEFKDLFAWKPNDMSDINNYIIFHVLKIDPNMSLKNDYRRGQETDIEKISGEITTNGFRQRDLLPGLGGQPSSREEI